VLGIYLTVFVVEFELELASVNLGVAAEAVAILIAPLGLALGLGAGIKYLSPRIVTICAVVSALVGTLQLFAPGVLSATGFSDVLSAAIPRLTYASQGVGGRGVSMLAPEPSYAAPSILLLMVAALWLRARGQMARWSWVVLITLMIWMTVLNASASLLISVLAFVLILAFGSLTRKALVPAAGLLLLSLWGVASFQYSDIRPVRVAGEVSALITSGNANLDSFVALSREYGSGRLSSVVQGYGGSIVNGGMGLGIGSWDTWISSSGTDTKLLEGYTKPFAYGAFVAMTLGLPGLIALFYGLFRLGLNAATQRPIGLVLATIAIGVTGILVNSPASLPAYWAMVLFALPQVPSSDSKLAEPISRIVPRRPGSVTSARAEGPP
jgi:hypothetical protein